jgi:hypothetical protein
MTGHGQKFSWKKEQAVAALLSEPGVPQAAEKAGVAERTLYRWIQLEDFRMEFLTAKRRVVEQAVARCQKGMGTAVYTLEGIMTDSEAPASARVSAARTMLDLGMKAIEIEDLAERIARLEKALEMRSK